MIPLLPASGPTRSDPPAASVPSGAVLVGASALLLGAAACASSPPDGTDPGAGDARPEAAGDADRPAAAEAGCRGPGPGADLPEPGRRTRPVEARDGLDVLGYDLRLDLRRAADGRIRGRARISLRTGPGLERIRLDLVGLEVDSARLDGEPAACRHDGAVVEVAPRPAAGEAGADARRLAAGGHTVELFYRGRPQDGLVFGEDARGDPVVFSDNWPNRARWWFPSNDHPSDKATVRFEVRPPEGREVVANGRLTRRGGEGSGVWVWETEVPIPVYTMVVGVADFGTAALGEAACGLAPVAPGDCVDVSMWALPGDSAFGRRVLRRAPDMVDAYAERFGPFPYGKLAHVESGTRFGGMENASAIFYARQPWSAGEMGEGVVAHETVHQWFGDSVTPRRWSHLWVSEGFATYFAAVYFGLRDGREAFRRRMRQARDRYLGSDAVGRSVVDTTSDLYALLNANSYQKGAWVLHMLRSVVGDSAFHRGIRRYYAAHREGTATTADVRRAMEGASGRELGWFFDQWLRSPGHPRLEAEWWTERDRDAPGDAGAAVVLAVRQAQPDRWPTYRLPMTVAVDRARRPAARSEVEISGRVDTVRVPVEGEVEGVRLDPGDRVLKTLELERAPRPAPAGR